MNHNIYSVYDSKAEAYSLPFYMQHEAQAIRTFHDWANNPETPYYKHPEDFTLFHLGTYDEITATITQDKITSITTALQLKEPTQ